VVLALAIAVLLPVLYRIARPFLSAFVLGGILAVALNPLQNWVGRFVSRSSVAALITTLVSVGPILALIFLAGEVIERGLKSGGFSGILHAAQRFTVNAPLSSAPINSKVAQEVAAQFSHIAGGVFTLALSVVFVYVLLVHGHHWLAQLTALLPLDSAVTNRVVSTAREAIVANVDGIVAVAAAQAVLFGVIFWLAGIDSPVPWGALAGLASMLPVVGGTVIWLPIAVSVAIQGTWIRALLMGLGCLVGQTAVSELLRPRVVGKRVQQPPLLIALSILGATNAFGAPGILLGPVILAVLGALVRELRTQLQPEPPS
jgi:predicted PurR-regulated permease PerM